jgi:DNA helicase-2/ATP-dependent DNA helicase PcrA
MPSQNEIVVAAAGSGKTAYLVEEAFADLSKRILITTYTRENLREIQTRVGIAGHGRDHNVQTMSWFEFLLRHCVKPYQGYKTQILRIHSINFSTRRSAVPGLLYAKKSDFDTYYVDGNDDLYQDVVSDLACAIDSESQGKVISRLADCFDAILIDEIQDLAGPDLDLLERLFDSQIEVTAVGDPRQAIYATNTSNRNRQLRRSGIIDWLEQQVKAGRITVGARSESYRCNQKVCDFADALYPELPATTSRNLQVAPDMGVHLVHVDHLVAYRTTHSPQELRWDKRAKRANAAALNMGEVKGMAFDRVLVHPTGPITKYVETGEPLPEVSKAKLYVAITRARHSVGILTEASKTTSSLMYWAPDSESAQT